MFAKNFRAIFQEQCICKSSEASSESFSQILKYLSVIKDQTASTHVVVQRMEITARQQESRPTKAKHPFADARKGSQPEEHIKKDQPGYSIVRAFDVLLDVLYAVVRHPVPAFAVFVLNVPSDLRARFRREHKAALPNMNHPLDEDSMNYGETPSMAPSERDPWPSQTEARLQAYRAVRLLTIVRLRCKCILKIIITNLRERFLSIFIIYSFALIFCRVFSKERLLGSSNLKLLS